MTNQRDTRRRTVGNLWRAYQRSLEVNHERIALIHGDERWTYGDVAAAVAGAGDRLRQAGVGRATPTALLTTDGPTFPIHDLAVMSLGAVKVPLHPQLSRREIAEIVERVRPVAIIASPSLRPALELVNPATRVIDASVSLDATRAAGPVAGPSEASPAAEDDPAVVYFTGGTTGRPKGVVHTQRTVLQNLWSHLLESGIGRDERVLVTTPFPHAAGLFTLASLLRGATVFIRTGFDADDVIDIIDRESITWTFAVPTMIYRLIDAAEPRAWAPKTLRTIQYGGAPISPERLRQGLNRFGAVFQQLYAQTECPNYATVLSKHDHVRALEDQRLLSSCGQPVVMCDVAVLDEEGEVVPPGTVGEVALDAPYVMAGYWDDPDSEEQRFAGAWLRTGDIGYFDERRYLYLVDRRNDMIVSGGMNVYSVEVEQVIARHPGVSMVAVVGVPHDDWGEAVHAVVVPVSGAVDEGELAEMCRRDLANYKRPKSFEFAEELPLTRYGKIDKKALRARYWPSDRVLG